MENMEEKTRDTRKINRYSLILDESGQFTEGAKTTPPSIVAGIFVKGELPSEEWAWDYFRKVKASNSDYATINIDSFHGMEEKSPHRPAFITDLICAMGGDGAEIVVFKNQKGGMIVDSDITYLNVCADGVVALIRDLLQTDQDSLSLEILFAQRQAMSTKELNTKILDTVERQYKERINDLKWESRNIRTMAQEKYKERIRELEKEKENTRIRIEEEAYKRRIMERVELLLTKLSIYDQRRIERRITLSTGKAAKNPLLMLADAVCYALRGGEKLFTKEQKDRIGAVSIRQFAVPEMETWQTIENCFQQNHYAEGIFLWYGGFWKELSRYEKTFHRKIIEYFLHTDASAREAVTAILSQYLQQLVKNVHYELAESFISAMDKRFFKLIRENSLMQERKIRFERLYFDLHFLRLTIATHQGDYRTENEELDICRENLKHLPSTYETLDYYLKYKLREIEHLKNCYEFQEALEKLEELERSFKSMMEVVAQISELGGFSKGMTSRTLGSVYGSMTMTHCFLGLTELEHFAMADTSFKNSLAQFSEGADRSRSYQSRAAIAYWSKQWDDVMPFLSWAFTSDENGDAQAVLSAILQEKPQSFSFGMMHYTSAMARAMLAGNPLGDSMWDAWQKLSPQLGDKEEYPISIVLWRLATCAALRNDERAGEWYDHAIRQSMRNENAYVNLAAGLTMQMERLALLPADEPQEKTVRLQEDYGQFMNAEIPAAMRRYFTPWAEAIQNLDTNNLETQRTLLLKLAEQMPIL